MIQEIAPQKGVAFYLKAGQRLRVTDPKGKQVSDLFCVARLYTGEWLSSGRSIDYAERLYLSTGDLLYSNLSNPMLKIIEDTCGRHDFLLTPCSLKMFQIVGGNTEYHPSCDENLAMNLKKFGIPANRISTTFNIFMNVTTNDGKIQIEAPRSKTGDYIVFEALMDLVVGLTACSHEETNAGECKPIHYEVFS